MLSFASPWWFLLLPLPWLVARLAPPLAEGGSSVRVPFIARLQRLAGDSGGTGGAQGRERWLIALAWLALVTAIANPVRLDEPVTREQPARDLLLAVDLSASMATEDFTTAGGGPLSRLQAVKAVLADFLARRSGDRIGLIVFGSAPYVQLPPSTDTALMLAMVDEMTVGMAGPRTMLGDALGLAAKVFEESDLEERVVVLLTDGNDTGSRVPPREAARLCADRSIRLFTVGAGDAATVGEEALDEATLDTMAQLTGGSYFRASDHGQLRAVYEAIDNQIPRRVTVTSQRPRTTLFHWPLAVCWLCLLLLAPIPRRPAAHG